MIPSHSNLEQHPPVITQNHPNRRAEVATSLPVCFSPLFVYHVDDSLLFGSPRFVPHAHACPLLVMSGVLETGGFSWTASTTNGPFVRFWIFVFDSACRDAAAANVAALERARESRTRGRDTHRDLLLQRRGGRAKCKTSSGAVSPVARVRFNHDRGAFPPITAV